MTNERRNPDPTKRSGVAGFALETYHSTCRHVELSPTLAFRCSPFGIYGLVAFAGLWFWASSQALGASVAAARFGKIDSWETEKGLPENSVFSLLQTRDGYLWVGTGDGLARFDGIHFKTLDESDLLLSSGKIVRLFEDSPGNLWIGTETAGIVIVDKEGKITRLVEAGTGEAGRLVAICEDSGGAIWLSTSNRRVWRYRDGHVEPITKDANGLVADNSGLIWVGVQDANTGGGRLIGLGPIPPTPVPALPVAYELTVGELDYLLDSKAGGYWLLANNRVQKRKLDRVERDFGPYPWQATITCACEDAMGNLIVGTYGDGVYWLGADGGFNRLVDLPSSYIFSLCMDREGSLWVGTDGRGLNRVKQSVFDLLDKSRGLTVQSVCEDKQGGLWFGLNNGGVDYWKDGRLREYKTNEGLATLYVRSVFEDSSGKVWVGTSRELRTPGSGGLFELQGNIFKRIEGWPLISTAREQLVYPSITAIHEDRQGRLWFGSDQGLVCWEQQAWKGFTRDDGLCANQVQALASDSNGGLWVGTASGLNAFRAGQFTAFHKPQGLPSEDISSLYVDEQNVLWVGTSRGLARFDGTNWTHYSKENGLISNRIGYLAEDTEHYLWIGSLAGLMRVSKKELNDFARGAIRSIACRPYDVADGLPTSQCSAGSQPAAAVGRDGTLWFPTTKGLVSVRPDQIHPNTNPPPVRIEAVKIQGKTQTTNSIRAVPPSAVTIAARGGNLEIDYTSLNLAAPERARFRYRMDIQGRQASWIQTELRAAQFPKLSPGRYHFEVMACNEDGKWSDIGATLGVTVLPPFWRTTWFVTVTTLCLLGIVIGSVYYVSTQRLQRQLAFMRQQEAVEKERARIARDLHDQLGANLTQVALLGEMVETDKEAPDEVEGHARQISSTARETTRALDEIVWTVNPANDTLDGLVNYLCKYAQEYFALAGLRYRLDVPAELPSAPIAPDVRHNVFLAAKEAVNNVVKHAQASSAWLRLQLEPHRFILEIEDNGRGLKAGDQEKGRSGLRNMRKRMEDVGGEFDVGQGVEGGTRVRLIAPLRRVDMTESEKQKEPEPTRSDRI